MSSFYKYFDGFCSHIVTVKQEKNSTRTALKMDGKLYLFGLVFVLIGLSSVQCIVGGHRSVPDAAPFMVSVQNQTHICGGALVGDNWVLTTASCVDGKTNLKVLVGSDRLLTNLERVVVSRQIIHTKYNRTSGINNIALLNLQKSVTTTHVKVIALNDVAVTTGNPTEFYGWGSLMYGSSARSNELQTLYQKTLSAADCKAKYQNVLGLKDGFICAHIQSGQAACSKDEGGPLVAYNGKKLLGIYDHGVQCNGKYPDVFVSIATHKAWIDSTMVS